MERPTPTPRDGLPIGRAALFGTIAAGVAGIALAPRCSRLLSSAGRACPAASPASRRARRRLAHLQRHSRCPASTRGATSCASRARRAAARCAGGRSPAAGRAQVERLPLRHRLVGQDVHWEGIRPADDHRPRAPDARGALRLVALARGALRRPGLARSSSAARRAARAHMDGEPLTRAHGAPLRLVLPQMYGYKGVKWVRELRFDADADARLLGAARLRRRRLGRQVQRLWLSRARSGASRARERAAHWLLAVDVLRDALHRPLPVRPVVRGHPRPADGQGRHLWAPIALGAGLVLVALLGDRRALRAARASSTASTATTAAGSRRPAPPAATAGPLRRRAASTPARSSMPRSSAA